MRESLASFCQRNDRADLLREWDSEKIFPSHRKASATAARKKSGGPAHKATTGKPPCTPAPAAAQAAHTAVDASPSPEKTISLQNIHSSHRNGTQRKTAISHQIKYSPAAIASSGGAVHMAISGAHR